MEQLPLSIYQGISNPIQKVVIPEDQLELIEIFLSEVREGIEHSTFKDQIKILDLLNVHGNLAIENDEKAVYVKCILGQQLLPAAQISPLSSIHEVNTITLTACIVLDGLKREKSPIAFNFGYTCYMPITPIYPAQQKTRVSITTLANPKSC